MPKPSELRYHIQLIDESGQKLNLNNLTRDEVDMFNASHDTDDMDYAVKYSPRRSLNVSVEG